MLERGYEAFCRFAHQKTFSLIGLGRSNLPLVKFLYEAGAKNVVARDLKMSPEHENARLAVADGAELRLGEKYLDNLCENVILRSPVIRPDLPEFLQAIQGGAELYCETDLFLRFADCKTIAVTGSDGKTTTTTLISEILNTDGYHVLLGGNIGMAMLPNLMQTQLDKTVAVMELSSFQLMGAKSAPDVSVITNLSENHLDWHRDMSEYRMAKAGILNPSKNSVSVLNLDCDDTSRIKTNGRLLHFSRMKSVKSGAYFSDGKIYFSDHGQTKAILDCDDIKIPGMHNVENFMAAICAVNGLVKQESIQTVAENFRGVEHRIEFVREIEGVRFYNSSIDSSPARSIACLRAFDQKILMIAGGYDKNLNYDLLGNEICKRVKVLVLIGVTADKIESAVFGAPQKEKPLVFRAKTLREAVLISKEAASHGDVVVLSPASASFDQFKNFEERGNLYKKITMELS